MSSFPHLTNITSFLDQSKEEITTLWLARKEIEDFFKKFHIKDSVFQEKFGIPVLEYFIGVIDGSNKIGACPVINKLITYLVERNVQAQDIFILCMGLRRSMIEYLLTNQKIEHDILAYLNEISDIFDQNLAGVLDAFGCMSNEKDKELQHQKEINQRQKHIQSILNFQDNMICVVSDEHITLANRAFLEAYHVKNLQELHQKYPDYQQMISQIKPNSEALLNGNYTQWLETLASQHNKNSKIYLYNKDTDTTGAYLIKASKLPSEKQEFILSFTDISEMDNELKSIQATSYHDPITHIYNSTKFDLSLDDAIDTTAKEKIPFSLLFVEINNIGIISYHYGQAERDAVLLKVVEQISQLLDESLTFARISSGRFGIICPDYDAQKTETLALSIMNQIKGIQYAVNEFINFSIAILEYRDNETKKNLINRAQMLLEQIKEEGGNKILNDETIVKTQKIMQQEVSLIIKELNNLFDKNETLKISASYKELLISAEMKIIDIHNDTVTLQAISEKSPLFLPKQIYLTSPLFSKNILADVMTNNSSDFVITLSNFHYMKTSLFERKQIRVEPDQTISAVIKSNHTHAVGNIIDISSNSVKIAVTNLNELTVHEKVFTRFKLSQEEGSTAIELNGTVYAITKHHESYEIVIVFVLNAKNTALLSTYISQRQLQIIKEYKNMMFFINHKK